MTSEDAETAREVRNMLKIYKTHSGLLSETEEFEEGVWVDLAAPSMEEIRLIAEQYQIDADDIVAILDDEETSRVEQQAGYLFILIDIPSEEVRHERSAYTTIPLGVFLTEKAVITVCAEQSDIFLSFLQKNGTQKTNTNRSFSTKKQTRFDYQLLYAVALEYQRLLRYIDRSRREIENRAVNNQTQDTDLIDLHELESNLVYFTASLKSNMLVINRLVRYERIKQYSEDKELLDDVVIENQQASEMTDIYINIIHGSRELISNIINDKLNRVMKLLTAITLVMGIPSIVSGLYGMNVDERWMPLAQVSHGFEIICGGIAVICFLILLIMKKKKLL